MGRRTRLFVFPGGVLEVADNGDADGSLYLELTPVDRALPQRVPGAAIVNHAASPADAETCAKVLRLLRDLP